MGNSMLYDATAFNSSCWQALLLILLKCCYRYCFPTDSNRVITAAEQAFFNNIDTGKVPVIAIFTKFDALDAAACKTLEDNGIPFEQAK